MPPRNQLLEKCVLNRGGKDRSIYPPAGHFLEVIPMSLKNRVTNQHSRPAGSSCVQELQSLFGCMKKWEFDDVHCRTQHDLYMACERRAHEAAQAYNDAAKKGILGDSSGGPRTLSALQVNKIMNLFPQPNLGQQPYRCLKRLPQQNYADDLFHQKSRKGKPS